MPAPRAATARSRSADRHLVAVLERIGPDAAREAVALALLHQLEQVGLLPALDELPRVRLHGAAAGVGLEAAAPPTRAAGAVALDHDVADLAGRAAAAPELPVEDEAAADARSPPDSEEGRVRPARAELELRGDRDLDVVLDPDSRSEGVAEGRRERKGLVPVGQVAGVGDRARVPLDGAGGADPEAAQLVDRDSRGLGRFADRSLDLRGDCGAARPRSASPSLPRPGRRFPRRPRRPGSWWLPGRRRRERSSPAQRRSRMAFRSCSAISPARAATSSMSSCSAWR